MVTKLKTNATYRLIDKDGWFATHSSIEKLFISHFNQDGEITIEGVYEDGHGWRKGEFVIDAEKDLEFFEEKLKPKSWQEQVCEEFNIDLCNDGDFYFQNILTEHRVIEMAKRIIELTEGETK